MKCHRIETGCVSKRTKCEAEAVVFFLTNKPGEPPYAVCQLHLEDMRYWAYVHDWTELSPEEMVIAEVQDS